MKANNGLNVSNEQYELMKEICKKNQEDSFKKLQSILADTEEWENQYKQLLKDSIIQSIVLKYGAN